MVMRYVSGSMVRVAAQRVWSLPHWSECSAPADLSVFLIGS